MYIRRVRRGRTAGHLVEVEEVRGGSLENKHSDCTVMGVDRLQTFQMPFMMMHTANK